MAYDHDGVLKGGHVIWWDVLKDAEGNLISAREGEAEPIEGALQPGCAFADLLDQTGAQLLASVAAKDAAISQLTNDLDVANDRASALKSDLASK